jgi:hypothetical protein
MTSKQIIVRRRVPELIKIRGRQVSTRPGTYSNRQVVQLIKTNQHLTFSPKQIADMQFPGQRNKKDNEAYVRRRLSQAYTELQNDGVLCYPVYDEFGKHKIKYLKVYQGDDEDLVTLPVYLKRALKRKEITTEHYKKLVKLAKQIKP